MTWLIDNKFPSLVYNRKKYTLCRTILYNYGLLICNHKYGKISC